MNYLENVDHAAENLQFFLWFRNYKERYYKATNPFRTPPVVSIAGKNHHSNSVPGSSGSVSIPDRADITRQHQAIDQKDGSSAMLDAQEMADCTEALGIGKALQPVVPDIIMLSTQSRHSAMSPWNECLAEPSPKPKKSYADIARDTFVRFGIERAAESDLDQPFREEIDRIVALYISEEGDRQINLSFAQKQEILEKLSCSFDPVAFETATETVGMS